MDEKIKGKSDGKKKAFQKNISSNYKKQITRKKMLRNNKESTSKSNKNMQHDKSS